MTLSRYVHTGAAPATGLASGISSSATSFTVLSGTGYPSPAAGQSFVVCIDAGATSEEKILCSARSGTTFTVASGGRGYDGTTAASHSAGTTNVTHVLSAAEVDDNNDHVYTTSRNDHTQYVQSVTAADSSITVGGTTQNPTVKSNNTTGWARLYCSAAPAAASTVQVTGNTGSSGGTNAPTTSATSITITAAGQYLVATQVSLSVPSGVTGFVPSVTIKQNGTDTRYFFNVATGTTTGTALGAGGADVLTCAANDVLTYYVSSGSSSNANVQTGSKYTWLSVVKVG